MKHFFIRRPILSTAFCMLACVTAITSCDKDNPAMPMLQIDQQSVVCPAESNSQTININSDVNWQASVDSPWITLQPASGNGNGKLEIQVSANPSTSERTGTVTVEAVSGDVSQSISITQKGMEEMLKVSNSEIRLGSLANSSGTFTITSNLPWTITATDETWLNISSVSGEGDGTITLTTRSDNESSAARECEIVIKAGSSEARVKIVQPGLYIPDCTVKINDMVILSTSVAFDCIYDDKVAFFYWWFYSSEEIKKYSDKEIIENISEDISDRWVPDDSILWIRYLTPLTEYVICTVAFDKNGNHGDLVKTPFTTKSDKNQAEAVISGLRYDAADKEWTWTTTPNATTSKYYMHTTSSEDLLYDDCDAYLAFLFKKWMEAAPDDYPPYVQKQNWYSSTENNQFQVLTWALDAEGNFSGIIGRSRRERNSSPAKVKDQEKRTTRGGIIAKQSHLKHLMEQVKPIKIR